MTAAVEPVQRKLVLVGAGRVLVYDPAPTELVTTGASTLASGFPGLAFTRTAVTWSPEAFIGVWRAHECATRTTGG